MSNINLYEQAKTTLAEYVKVDDVLDFRTKAKMAQEYAKRANDSQLEHDAAKARIRAERRCGELLIDMDMNKGGRPSKNQSSESTSLKDIGISKDQSSSYQTLARINDDDFEGQLDDQAVPQSGHMVKNQREKEGKKASDKAVPPIALYWWGRLRDFARDDKLDMSINDVIKLMPASMKKDTHNLLPLLIDWVNEYEC